MKPAHLPLIAVLLALAPQLASGATRSTSKPSIRSQDQEVDEEAEAEFEEEDDSPSNSLSLEEQTGGSDFGSTTLSGRISVSKPTTLTFSVNRSNTEGLTPYGSATLGADFELDDDRTLNTDLKYSREPNEIFSRGGSVALEWTVFRRGSNELETTLTPGFEANALSSENGTGKKLRKLSKVLYQLTPSLGLGHALTQALSLSVSYSHAFYTNNPANLSRAVSNRRMALSGDGIVSGFVSDTWTLSSTVKISERWSLTATASDARLTLDQSHTRNYNGGPSWQISEAWAVAGEAGVSIPESGASTTYGSLEATWSW